MTYFMKDRLGLRTMEENGKLHFFAVDGDHIQFSEKWFSQTIIDQFFR